MCPRSLVLSESVKTCTQQAPNLFYVFLPQVQLLTAPTSTSYRNLQVKGGSAPETSLLMGAVPAQGAPGEQGPAGRYITLLCMNE